MTFLARALAVCALGFCAQALAQEAPRWYLQIDNDFFFGTDRWNSSTVRVARVTRHGERELEWAVQHDVWGPDAKKFELGQVEREPASRLVGAVALHDRDLRRHVTLEATLGVRGPAALGEEITDLIHAVIPARDVNWARQRDNRVEAQLTYARSDFLGRAFVHHGVVAGTTHVFAHAGAEWRFGDAEFAAFTTPLLRFAPTPPWDGRTRVGWNGFVGVNARYVARNAILGEPYDPVSARVEREKAVGRIVGGSIWVRPWGTVVLAIAGETREFTAQRTAHGFGSLTVHVPF